MYTYFCFIFFLLGGDDDLNNAMVPWCHSGAITLIDNMFDNMFAASTSDSMIDSAFASTGDAMVEKSMFDNMSNIIDYMFVCISTTALARRRATS